jgi:hypothetical protein
LVPKFQVCKMTSLQNEFPDTNTIQNDNGMKWLTPETGTVHNDHCTKWLAEEVSSRQNDHLMLIKYSEYFNWSLDENDKTIKLLVGKMVKMTYVWKCQSTKWLAYYIKWNNKDTQPHIELVICKMARQ